MIAFTEYYARDRPEMVGFIPITARRLLDVGCAEGAFGNALLQRHNGVELHGIEMDRDAAAQAAKTYTHVSVGSFPEDLAEGTRDLDCVVFNDVLEHMEDPWTALRALHPHLAPGATVVASIPSVRYFPVLYKLAVRGEWTYMPAGVLDRTHLRFFTRQSIRELFETTGYSVEMLRGINPLNRWQLRVLGKLAPRFIDDVRHPQFAVVARSRENP
jgi:2-polyprenyl-3-methyl-5-hydroxy-6-metoxy-1,4-benzoquinol methylase